MQVDHDQHDLLSIPLQNAEGKLLALLIQIRAFMITRQALCFWMPTEFNELYARGCPIETAKFRA
jgi:hypothetical protein